MVDYVKACLALLAVVSVLLQCVLAFEDDDDDDGCGFPGAPAFGYVRPDQDEYDKGDIVTYSCRVGYILLGTSARRCNTDGSWTDDVPICDDSMTTLGFASSTPTLPSHSADMAIDRKRDTCTYLKPKKPRFWRIDLGGLHQILSVAITMNTPDKPMKYTVYVIEILGTSSSYKRCASFEGKFGSRTMLHTCAEGKGLAGQKVHIEDHRFDDIFEICEVEVQVEKDTGYDCGRPDRNLFSMTEAYEAGDDEVEYSCKPGYELVGDSTRECETTGQWDGEAPVCKPIECEPLKPPENGELSYSLVENGNIPLEGSTAIYRCSYGYSLEGDITRHCRKDGKWTGKDPTCKVIRCALPPRKPTGEMYILQNTTNRVGSIAKLVCKKGDRIGDDPYMTCTINGEWTEPKATCALPVGATMEIKEQPRIVNRGGLIFGMAASAIMMVIILVAFYVVKRRREANKPEVPSRQKEPVPPPPRPPPRGLKSTIVDLVTRDSSGHKYDKMNLEDGETPAAWKTRSLPLDAGNAEGMKDDTGAPRRTMSYDDPEKLASRPKSTETEETVPEEKRDTYASVDYDRKRQSRLLKEQDSEERSQETTPTAGGQLRELPPIPKEEEEEEEMRAQSAGTAPSPFTDKEKEEAASEISEDVSLPIAASPASEAPTPSPDVVVENQVEGPSASPTTPTSDITPGRRRRRTPGSEQPSTEEVPEAGRRRTRRRADRESEEPVTPSATPVEDERPGRRGRQMESPPATPVEGERPARRARQMESPPATPVEDERPARRERQMESPPATPVEDERPARRGRQRGGSPVAPVEDEQPTNRRAREADTPSETPEEEERPTRRTRPSASSRFDTPSPSYQPPYTRRRY